MKMLNTQRSCRVVPLNVEIKDETERKKFIINQVKENRSAILTKNLGIGEIEIKISIEKYKGEGDSLNMFLFGVEEGVLLSKPFYVGDGFTAYTYRAKWEDILFFKERKFNRIGFTSNNDDILISFSIVSLSQELAEF